MPDLHPLVRQLLFTRSEFKRGLRGLTTADAAQRFLPMNCISWNIGHLAWQEQRYFIYYSQPPAERRLPFPRIDAAFAYGAPASTPPFIDVLSAWRRITALADEWLHTVTTADLQAPVLNKDGSPGKRMFGSLLQRTIYHYWFHTGENAAIRQMLGHTRLPQFVGNIDEQAPYIPA